MVWTPRRESGRPLTFQPLPDFGAVLDDVDEFNAAVDAAVEALAPRVGVHRASTRAAQEKAVLTEAMRWFGRGAGHDLGVFIDLLSALPEHVTEIAKGPLLAAELADRLRAVRATDPLFGGVGEPADPGTLLTPPPGKRARISVISSVGMASLEQWQGFVNQLQMALFSWVKRNPAEDRPLGGLLVMDEAQDLVPSVGTTACSESTRRLASQARKYGLGLLFATQSPKSLHNSIPGNATTQLFGLLSSPVQIGAARELAWAKGGNLPDIGRLSSGQFYLATEGSAFRQIRTPMCLSHHPSSPLTEEEVLSRAAGRWQSQDPKIKTWSYRTVPDSAANRKGVPIQVADRAGSAHRLLAVEGLADDVGVPRVLRGLGDDVQQRPAGRTTASMAGTRGRPAAAGSRRGRAACAPVRRSRRRSPRRRRARPPASRRRAAGTRPPAWPSPPRSSPTRRRARSAPPR